MRDFANVAVVGFGKMGSGIAQVVAQSGRRVVVVDETEDRLLAGRDRVGDFLAEGVRRGKTTAAERDEVLGRITGTTDLADLRDADLVIEAVLEERETKLDLFRRLSEVVSEDTILTTNTSALSVTDLAIAVQDPGRFAGLHWFNPPVLMRLIEVIKALQTRDDVVADLLAFSVAVGKVPVSVSDRPGFLVNKLLIPYLNDVIDAYDKGLASAEDIDVAIELGLGHKMGPMRLLDLIGLDVHHHATGNAYEQTRDQQFAPPVLLTQMVAAGFAGGAGVGFRAYGAEHDRPLIIETPEAQ